MAIRLYMDHHVHRAITTGLRSRGVAVITAREDNAHTLDDSELLTRASALGRVVFTICWLRRPGANIKARLFQVSSMHIKCMSPLETCINNLELIAKASESQELESMVLFLPL